MAVVTVTRTTRRRLATVAAIVTGCAIVAAGAIYTTAAARTLERRSSTLEYLEADARWNACTEKLRGAYEEARAHVTELDAAIASTLADGLAATVEDDESRLQRALVELEALDVELGDVDAGGALEALDVAVDAIVNVEDRAACGPIPVPDPDGS